MTTPVPKASDRRQIAAGILHFPGGESHIVPGVGRKERSDLGHGKNRQRSDHDDRAADSDLHGVLRAESGVVPEVCAEIRRQSLRIAPEGEAERRQSEQRRNFRGGEYVLNRRARLDAKDVDDRQENHQQDRHQVLGVDPDFHVAQNHRADVNRRNFPEMQQPVRRRNRRNEDAEELAEGHAHGGDGAGLNHQEQRPAVEKSPERPQGFAQVNVLPAGAGHHGGQFAVAERGHDGHESGNGPGSNQQRRRTDFAADLGRHNEDAGADHRAHDQHGRAGQA